MTGTGIDIVHLGEFGKLAESPLCAFVQEHFTPAEIAYSESASGTALSHLGVRYAAKEACIKALEEIHLFRPAPLSRINYRDIEILHDPYGRPYLHFYGEIEKLVTSLDAKAFVSLSHDGDYAMAQVIFS